MTRLKELYGLTLEPATDFNLRLTASAYNFSWFFDGRRLITPLSSRPPTVAVVEEDGALIKATCYGGPLSRDEAQLALEFKLGLSEDLSEFYSIAFEDPLLAAVPRRLAGMKLRASPPWFSFIAALCQQNASFRQGWGMVHRVLNLLGRWVEVESRVVPLPPSPREVVEAGLEVLRRAGLGFRASALLRAAEALMGEGVEEPSVEELSLLRGVKGVGEYTLRVAKLFAARAYEEPPVDRWLLKVVSEAYRRPLRSIKEAEGFIKERWRRWGGLFAYFTTIVTDAEPGEAALERVRRGFLEPLMDSPKPTPMTLWRHL